MYIDPVLEMEVRLGMIKKTGEIQPRIEQLFEMSKKKWIEIESAGDSTVPDVPINLFLRSMKAHFEKQQAEILFPDGSN